MQLNSLSSDEVPDRAPRLQFAQISKSFGDVHALRDVSLHVRAGEVLALMGENGAGKSTLLGVLSGKHNPTDGTIMLDGEAVRFAGPRAATHAGIRVIQQEPEVVPGTSVAENIYIGALPQRARIVDRRGLLAQARDALAEYGFDGALDPTALGADLSAAQRQLVEIMRALVNDVRVLALDEPTSSLSEHEVELLFSLVRRLRAAGKAIIYVSHRMPEIFAIADRVAVLRDGRYVGDREIADTDTGELVRMMVGRDLSDMFVREPHPVGDVVLDARGVTTRDVHDVSLQVRAGEVVGVGGLVGAGRSEFAHALVGDVPLSKGSVWVDGVRIRLRAPADALRAGIGLAPEERKAQAVLLHRSVRDNVALAILDRLARLRIVRRREERELALRYVGDLSIRTPSIEHEAGSLSGGNQQKVVLARWLARRPKVLILDEPTRGVDVGAKAEIYSIISGLAADGLAVLVISSELPELLGLSDRIVVMRSGAIVGELSRAEASEERVLALAMPDQINPDSLPTAGVAS